MCFRERFEMLCDEDLSLDKTKMQKVLKISSAECDAVIDPTFLSAFLTDCP